MGTDVSRSQKNRYPIILSNTNPPMKLPNNDEFLRDLEIARIRSRTRVQLALIDALTSIGSTLIAGTLRCLALFHLVP